MSGSARDVAAAVSRESIAVNVWIDLAQSSVVTVYVAAGHSVFVRRLDFGPSFDAVALDLVDAVVASSVATVLAGLPIGVPQEEFRRSLEPDVPVQDGITSAPARSAAVPATQIAYAAAGVFEASWLTSTTPTGAPGLRIIGETERYQLAVGVRATLPYEVVAGGATIRFTSAGLRLSAGRVLPLRPWLALILSIGAGADILRVEPASSQPDLVPASSFHATDLFLRSTAELEGRVGRLKVGVTAGADANLEATSYVVATPSGARAIWTPWRVHPVLVVLLGVVLR